jgi:hypothetical protein
MDEEALNTSVRKFLKKLGVTAQREIEMAVRNADAKGQLKGSDPLPAKAVVTVGGIDLKFEIDGDIELERSVPMRVRTGKSSRRGKH